MYVCRGGLRLGVSYPKYLRIISKLHLLAVPNSRMTSPILVFDWDDHYRIVPIEEKWGTLDALRAQ